MRTISKDNLPLHYHQHTVIKGKERCHYQRMATSLERTLARCNEMYAEYESHTLVLRENSRKEGFSVGFELFFSQMLKFLMIMKKDSLSDSRLSEISYLVQLRSLSMILLL